MSLMTSPTTASERGSSKKSAGADVSVDPNQILTDECVRQARGSVHWTPLIVISLIHVGALLAFLPMFFTWQALVMALFLQFSIAMGVTVGYHRLLTHRSFKTIKPIEYFLSWLGSMSLEGGPVLWVATHRLHHQHSDKDGDPHSPNHGFFWSHVFWTFKYDPEFDPFEKHARYAADLAKDRGHVFIQNFMPISQILVAVALYFLGGWPFVVWGGFVRLVYVYHITWLVNSATHTWGYRSFKTTDQSTNLWWVAMLAMGEGWHNNHHAFPSSAKHGLNRGEFDVSWICIKTLSLLGLASDIKLPDKETIEAHRISG